VNPKGEGFFYLITPGSAVKIQKLNWNIAAK
jgi:hypothetical protein